MPRRLEHLEHAAKRVVEVVPRIRDRRGDVRGRGHMEDRGALVEQTGERASLRDVDQPRRLIRRRETASDRRPDTCQPADPQDGATSAGPMKPLAPVTTAPLARSGMADRHADAEANLGEGERRELGVARRPTSRQTLRQLGMRLVGDIVEDERAADLQPRHHRLEIGAGARLRVVAVNGDQIEEQIRVLGERTAAARRVESPTTNSSAAGEADALELRLRTRSGPGLSMPA